MKIQHFLSGDMNPKKRRLSIVVRLFLFFFLMLMLSAIIPHGASARTTATCVSPVPTPVAGPTTVLPALPGIILINEILPTPGFPWNCSNSIGNNIWIELYNPLNQAFDLYSARAYIDTGPGTQPSIVPFGATIAPHGFLVLFPFPGRKLTATTLRLCVGDTPITVIDSVSLSSLELDISYARQTDGGPTWTITDHPTIGTSNVPPVITPTPTETLKPTPTPKTTPTPKPTATPHPQKGGNQNTSPGDEDATPKTLIDGTQPDWHTLAIVSTPYTLSGSPTAIVPKKTPQVQSALPPPQPATTGDDLPHKVFLTLLATALMSALLWSYRLFGMPGSGG